VRCSDIAQFFFGFRQSHIENGFAASHSLEQELHRQGGFAGAGHAFDQIKSMGREASAENIVKSVDADRVERTGSVDIA
jgi:hypothetical protein